MNKLSKILLVLPAAAMLTSCFRSAEDTGRQYMPDMVESSAYETNDANPVYNTGMTTRLPVAGSIPRDGYTYTVPATPEGYEQAGATVKNPFTFTDAQIDGEGKKLFNIYCAICHGEKGDGQGFLPGTGKYPPPPSYFSADIISKPEGKYYHTVVHGKGMMGSYAFQLNHEERWLVIAYIHKLQAQNAPKDAAAAAPAEAAAPAAATTQPAQ